MSRSRDLLSVRWTLALTLACGLSACEEDIAFVPLDDAAPLNDAGGDAASPDTAPALVPQGFVVVHSDYQSTSVSLLDRNGGLTKGDCLHSGSVSATLNLALSGDVTLPSQPAANGEVVLIDRGAATLTYLDPVTCTPRRQVKVGTGFAANPHDVVTVAGGPTYVTRYESSPTAATAENPFAGGSDLLVIDAQLGTPVARIDLTTTTTSNAFFPRPDRVIALGGKLYVSLNHLSQDFASAGPGRIAVVDPTTNQVTSVISLPTLKNCGEMVVVGPETLMIACGGAFSDGLQSVDFAGVARVDARTGTSLIVAARLFGNRSVAQTSLAARDADRFFAVTNGDFGGPATDQLWTASVLSQTASSAATAGESFVFGGLLFDPETSRLYVADGSASTPQVRVFAVDAASALTPLAAIVTSPSLALPPRQIAWY